MSADRNRNRTRPPSLIGTLGIQPHVVGGNDVDAREVLLLDHEPIHSGVEAELPVFCDHDAGRDHRATVVDRRHWYRKPEEIDRVADLDDFFVGSGLRVSRFDWMFNAVLQLRFDLPVGLTAHRHDGACAGPEDAGNDGNVIADHGVEHQSCLCLIHQGCDMTDVYRLPDVGKLVFLPESFEQIAEGFLRVLLRAHTMHLVLRLINSFTIVASAMAPDSRSDEGAMLIHCDRGATTKTGPFRRNPSGRWGLRAISSSRFVGDERASPSSSLLDLASQSPIGDGKAIYETQH